MLDLNEDQRATRGAQYSSTRSTHWKKPPYADRTPASLLVMFSKFQNKVLIKVEGKQIRILDIDRL